MMIDLDQAPRLAAEDIRREVAEGNARAGDAIRREMAKLDAVRSELAAMANAADMASASES